MGLFSLLFKKKKKPDQYIAQGNKVSFIEDDDKRDDVENTMVIHVKPPEQKYIIKNEGKYHIFESKEDMPSDILSEIEELENKKNCSHSYTVVIDGKRSTYSHVDEMPEDIRAAFSNKK